jgi:hypothetical protein
MHKACKSIEVDVLVLAPPELPVTSGFTLALARTVLKRSPKCNAAGSARLHSAIM